MGDSLMAIFSIIFILLSTLSLAEAFEKVNILDESYWQRQVGSDIYLIPSTKKFQLSLVRPSQRLPVCEKVIEKVDEFLQLAENCFEEDKCVFSDILLNIITREKSFFRYSMQPNRNVGFHFHEVIPDSASHPIRRNKDTHLVRTLKNVFEKGEYQIMSGEKSRINRLKKFPNFVGLFKGEVLDEGWLLTTDRLSACEIMSGNAWIATTQETDVAVPMIQTIIEPFDRHLRKFSIQSNLIYHPIYLQGAMIGWESGKYYSEHRNFREFIQRNQLDVSWVIENFYQVTEDSLDKIPYDFNKLREVAKEKILLNIELTARFVKEN